MGLTVAQIVKKNEAKLERLILWLQHDAAARTMHRSYGYQEIRVDWQDGVIVTTTISEKHTFKDEVTLPLEEIAPEAVDRNGRRT